MLNTASQTIELLLVGQVDVASLDAGEVQSWMQASLKPATFDRLLCFLLRAHLLRWRSEPESTLKSMLEIRRQVYEEFHGEMLSMYEELLAHEYIKSSKPIAAISAGMKALELCDEGSAIELRAHRTIAIAQLQIGELSDAINRIEQICLPIAVQFGNKSVTDSVLLQAAYARWIASTASASKRLSYWNLWPMPQSLAGSTADHCLLARTFLSRVSTQEYATDGYYFLQNCRALFAAVEVSPREGFSLMQVLIRECGSTNDYLAMRCKLDATMLARWSEDWSSATRFAHELTEKLQESVTLIALGVLFERAQMARHSKDWQLADQLGTQLLNAQLCAVTGVSNLFLRDLAKSGNAALNLPRQARDICEALANVESFGQSLERVLDRIGVSRRTAEIVLRREFGRSPADFRIEQKMVYARQLVLETNLSVNAIAERTGFSSAGSFSTAYRRLHGCSPTEDRRTRGT